MIGKYQAPPERVRPSTETMVIMLAKKSETQAHQEAPHATKSRLQRIDAPASPSEFGDFHTTRDHDAQVEREEKSKLPLTLGNE